MANSVKIGKEDLLGLIESVLLENKTFLKIDNGGGQTPPPMAPPVEQVPPMAGPMPQQDMGMEGGDLADPAAGGEDENQFDTNFDAGVEADEESDPKTYIQQLTGKLSQSLNSFNDEQGADAGLNKYVASMIVTAACKNLDDKAKKEIIDKINSAQSDTDVDTPDNGELENGDMGDGADLQECVYSKKQIMEMVGVGVRPEGDEQDLPVKQDEPVKTIFKGKIFNK